MTRSPARHLPRTRALALCIALLWPLAPAFARQAPAAPQVEVYRSPTCGCCLKWVDHLRANGFQVAVRDSDDMQAVKQRLGVPEGQRSCHTARVGGYFIEGHVPAADIQRLLDDKPAARGIAVAGMPLGSPGMEMPNGNVQPYAVELVARDGKATVYARHGQ